MKSLTGAFSSAASAWLFTLEKIPMMRPSKVFGQGGKPGGGSVAQGEGRAEVVVSALFGLPYPEFVADAVRKLFRTGTQNFRSVLHFLTGYVGDT
jgi:hypothetical protein